MTRMASLALCILFLGACASNPGFSIGDLRCDSEVWGDAVYDYGQDAVGYETIGEAIEAFRAEGDWHLREDWHELMPGDMSSSPVKFTDDRGWVYLSVELVQLNDSWVVSGYASCSP